MKNLLFITWDGPQTSYMEGLFLPIFHEVQKQNPNWTFHVLQFTWGDADRIAITKGVAENYGIHYQAVPISRKPIAGIGSFITLFRGPSAIQKYISEHQIDVVMPRSTSPAYMVNHLKQFKGKIIFDADGLPIEERVDFAGLKRNSYMYRFLKTAETRMLKKADSVITRSQKAIDIHVRTVGVELRSKFSVVYNGRDSEIFEVDDKVRESYREKLGVADELLFVYAGSLGPQYCFKEMLEIFTDSFRSSDSQIAGAKFLILSGNLDYVKAHIPEELKEQILLMKVAAEDVPNYLNTADIAFALRQPSFSMQGVAPIKLGEYLLMNLPTIASKGIGDTDQILAHFNQCFLFDHSVDINRRQSDLRNWIQKVRVKGNSGTREEALKWFSLEAAAKSYLAVLDNS